MNVVEGSVGIGATSGASSSDIREFDESSRLFIPMTLISFANSFKTPKTPPLPKRRLS